jgi:hypothetical protein
LKWTIKIWSGHFEITNNDLLCTNSLKFNIRRGYKYFQSFQKILLNVLYNEMRLKKGSEGILGKCGLNCYAYPHCTMLFEQLETIF